MEFRLHQGFSEIDPAAWNELASTGISDTPFARHEYLQQWWRTLGGAEWSEASLILISGWDSGRLVGLAPLFKAKHDGRDAILLVGSIEISDYLDLIVRDADLPAFASGMLEFLAELPDSRLLPLDWYNIPESSPTTSVLQGEAKRRGWGFDADVYLPAPHVSLNGDFESYLAGLDKKQRHEIRRKLRRASEGSLPARMRLVESEADLEHEIDAFLVLMAHDPEKARFLNPEMREHMRAVIRLAFQNGYLHLAFLSVGDTNAAASLDFDYRNKLWGYNSGVNPEFTELSPGWVLLAHQIQWATEHNRSEFDFMRGSEDYKYRFGGIDRRVLRVQVSPR
jgi:CelD/BcsL family acetyltransferase involved in cellulose biosynthesis